MISLCVARGFTLPVTAECISPDVLWRLTAEQINEMPVWEGNKRKKLGALFNVTREDGPSAEEAAVTVSGELSKVRRIGSLMQTGTITINGDVGMYLGEEMKGGRILVNGDVGRWAGSMMKGGTIEVRGSAGDYLAAPYRGSTEGMRGGTIVVHGNAGNEAGAHMKRGIIRVHGDVGEFAGLRMRDGVIYVGGRCGDRAGACMTGGKIVAAGPLDVVLPTFTLEGIRPKAKIGESESVEGPFYVFSGDIAERGDGKLYVSRQRNPHLVWYERFL